METTDEPGVETKDEPSEDNSKTEPSSDNGNDNKNDVSSDATGNTTDNTSNNNSLIDVFKTADGSPAAVAALALVTIACAAVIIRTSRKKKED